MLLPESVDINPNPNLRPSGLYWGYYTNIGQVREEAAFRTVVRDVFYAGGGAQKAHLGDIMHASSVMTPEEVIQLGEERNTSPGTGFRETALASMADPNTGVTYLQNVMVGNQNLGQVVSHHGIRLLSERPITRDWNFGKDAAALVSGRPDLLLQEGDTGPVRTILDIKAGHSQEYGTKKPYITGNMVVPAALQARIISTLSAATDQDLSAYMQQHAVTGSQEQGLTHWVESMLRTALPGQKVSDVLPFALAQREEDPRLLQAAGYRSMQEFGGLSVWEAPSNLEVKDLPKELRQRLIRSYSQIVAYQGPQLMTYATAIGEQQPFIPDLSIVQYAQDTAQTEYPTMASGSHRRWHQSQSFQSVQFMLAQSAARHAGMGPSGVQTDLDTVRRNMAAGNVRRVQIAQEIGSAKHPELSAFMALGAPFHDERVRQDKHFLTLDEKISYVRGLYDEGTASGVWQSEVASRPSISTSSDRIQALGQGSVNVQQALRSLEASVHAAGGQSVMLRNIAGANMYNVAFDVERQQTARRHSYNVRMFPEQGGRFTLESGQFVQPHISLDPQGHQQVLGRYLVEHAGGDIQQTLHDGGLGVSIAAGKSRQYALANVADTSRDTTQRGNLGYVSPENMLHRLYTVRYDPVNRSNITGGTESVTMSNLAHAIAKNQYYGNPDDTVMSSRVRHVHDYQMPGVVAAPQAIMEQLTSGYTGTNERGESISYATMDASRAARPAAEHMSMRHMDAMYSRSAIRRAGAAEAFIEGGRLQNVTMLIDPSHIAATALSSGGGIGINRALLSDTGMVRDMSRSLPVSLDWLNQNRLQAGMPFHNTRSISDADSLVKVTPQIERADDASSRDIRLDVQGGFDNVRLQRLYLNMSIGYRQAEGLQAFQSQKRLISEASQSEHGFARGDLGLLGNISHLTEADRTQKLKGVEDLVRRVETAWVGGSEEDQFALTSEWQTLFENRRWQDDTIPVRLDSPHSRSLTLQSNALVAARNQASMRLHSPDTLTKGVTHAVNLREPVDLVTAQIESQKNIGPGIAQHFLFTHAGREWLSDNPELAMHDYVRQQQVRGFGQNLFVPDTQKSGYRGALHEVMERFQAMDPAEYMSMLQRSGTVTMAHANKWSEWQDIDPYEAGRVYGLDIKPGETQMQQHELPGMDISTQREFSWHNDQLRMRQQNVLQMRLRLFGVSQRPVSIPNDSMSMFQAEDVLAGLAGRSQFLSNNQATSAGAYVSRFRTSVSRQQANNRRALSGFLTAAQVRQGITVDQSSILDVDDAMLKTWHEEAIRLAGTEDYTDTDLLSSMQTWAGGRRGNAAYSALRMQSGGRSVVLPSLESVRRLGHLEDTGQAGNMLSRVFMGMVRSVVSGETVDFGQQMEHYDTAMESLTRSQSVIRATSGHMMAHRRGLVLNRDLPLGVYRDQPEENSLLMHPYTATAIFTGDQDADALNVLWRNRTQQEAMVYRDPYADTDMGAILVSERKWRDMAVNARLSHERGVMAWILTGNMGPAMSQRYLQDTAWVDDPNEVSATNDDAIWKSSVSRLRRTGLRYEHYRRRMGYRLEFENVDGSVAGEENLPKFAEDMTNIMDQSDPDSLLKLLTGADVTDKQYMADTLYRKLGEGRVGQTGIALSYGKIWGMQRFMSTAGDFGGPAEQTGQSWQYGAGRGLIDIYNRYLDREPDLTLRKLQQRLNMLTPGESAALPLVGMANADIMKKGWERLEQRMIHSLSRRPKLPITELMSRWQVSAASDPARTADALANFDDTWVNRMQAGENFDESGLRDLHTRLGQHMYGDQYELQKGNPELRKNMANMFFTQMSLTQGYMKSLRDVGSDNFSGKRYGLQHMEESDARRQVAGALYTAASWNLRPQETPLQGVMGRALTQAAVMLAHSDIFNKDKQGLLTGPQRVTSRRLLDWYQSNQGKIGPGNELDDVLRHFIMARFPDGTTLGTSFADWQEHPAVQATVAEMENAYIDFAGAETAYDIAWQFGATSTAVDVPGTGDPTKVTIGAKTGSKRRATRVPAVSAKMPRGTTTPNLLDVALNTMGDTERPETVIVQNYEREPQYMYQPIMPVPGTTAGGEHYAGGPDPRMKLAAAIGDVHRYHETIMSGYTGVERRSRLDAAGEPIVDAKGNAVFHQDRFDLGRMTLSTGALTREVAGAGQDVTKASREMIIDQLDYHREMFDIQKRKPQTPNYPTSLTHWGGKHAQAMHNIDVGIWELQRDAHIASAPDITAAQGKVISAQEAEVKAQQRLQDFKDMGYDSDPQGSRTLTKAPRDAADYRRNMLRTSQVRDYGVDTNITNPQAIKRAQAEQLANITTAGTLFNVGSQSHGMGRDLMEAIEGLKDAVVGNTDITKDSSHAMRDLSGFTKHYSTLVGLEQEMKQSSASMFRQRQRAVALGVDPDAMDPAMQQQMHAMRQLQEYMPGAQATAASMGVVADPNAYAKRGNRFRSGWRGVMDRVGNIGSQAMQSMSGIGPMAYYMFAKYRIQSQMVEPYRKQVEMGADEQMLAEQAQYAMSGKPEMDYEDSISQTINQRKYEMAQISAEVGQRTAGQYHIGFRMARSVLSDNQLANVMTAGQHVQNVATGAAQIGVNAFLAKNLAPGAWAATGRGLSSIGSAVAGIGRATPAIPATPAARFAAMMAGKQLGAGAAGAVGARSGLLLGARTIAGGALRFAGPVGIGLSALGAYQHYRTSPPAQQLGYQNMAQGAMTVIGAGIGMGQMAGVPGPQMAIMQAGFSQAHKTGMAQFQQGLTTTHPGVASRLFPPQQPSTTSQSHWATQYPTSPYNPILTMGGFLSNLADEWVGKEGGFTSPAEFYGYARAVAPTMGMSANPDVADREDFENLVEQRRRGGDEVRLRALQGLNVPVGSPEGRQLRSFLMDKDSGMSAADVNRWGVEYGMAHKVVYGQAAAMTPGTGRVDVSQDLEASINRGVQSGAITYERVQRSQDLMGDLTDPRSASLYGAMQRGALPMTQWGTDRMAAMRGNQYTETISKGYVSDGGAEDPAANMIREIMSSTYGQMSDDLYQGQNLPVRQHLDSFQQLQTNMAMIRHDFRYGEGGMAEKQMGLQKQQLGISQEQFAFQYGEVPEQGYAFRQHDLAYQHQREQLSLGRTHQVAMTGEPGTEEGFTWIGLEGRHDIQISGRTQQQYQRTLQDPTGDRFQSRIGRSHWDLDWSEGMAGMEFGWRQEDLGRGIRLSTGREKRQLIRERDRSEVRFSMQENKREEQRRRLGEDEEWAGEDFDKSKGHLDEVWKLQDEMYQNQKNQLTEQVSYQSEIYQMQDQYQQDTQVMWQERWEKETEWATEQLGISEKRLALQKVELAFQQAESEAQIKILEQQEQISQARNMADAEATAMFGNLSEGINILNGQFKNLFSNLDGYVAESMSNTTAAASNVGTLTASLHDMASGPGRHVYDPSLGLASGPGRHVYDPSQGGGPPPTPPGASNQFARFGVRNYNVPGIIKDEQEVSYPGGSGRTVQ